MRLIDADALMETIRTHDYPLRSHFNSTDNGMFTIGIQQAVDMQPTIEERKKGRIVNPTPYGECSECGCLIDSRDGYNFCPNCGADMRPKLVGKHADVTIIDEACMKGADDETD